MEAYRTQKHVSGRWLVLNPPNAPLGLHSGFPPLPKESLNAAKLFHIWDKISMETSIWAFRAVPEPLLV